MSPFDQESRRLRRVLGHVNLRGLGDPLAEIGLFAGASDLPEVERRLREHVGQKERNPFKTATQSSGRMMNGKKKPLQTGLDRKQLESKYPALRRGQ